MFEAWRADYANYVDEPMPSVEHRPKTRHWQASKAAFRGGWINERSAARIILARISWTNLPPHLASAL